MGFFKKVWKGVKNVFKKVGKGIKNVVSKVGEVFSKIGIVGQIALAFILPGIGAALGGMFASGVGALAASTNPIMAAAGKVLATAGKFANTVGNAYKTVTEGISSFVSNMGKGMVNSTAKLMGKDAVFSNGPVGVMDGFKKWTEGVMDNVKGIDSPFSKAAEEVTKGVEGDYTKKLDEMLNEGVKQTSEEAVARGQTPDIMDITDIGISDAELGLPEVGGARPAIDMSAIKQEGPFATGEDYFRFKDVQPNQMEAIQAAESGVMAQAQRQAEGGVVEKYLKGMAGKVGDVVQDLPANVIEGAATTTSRAAVQKGLTKLGLQEEPEYNIQYHSNVIPSFDFTPVQIPYEEAGLNYGALPQNRIEYSAYNEGPMDFGQSAFQAFSQLRPGGA